MLRSLLWVRKVCDTEKWIVLLGRGSPAVIWQLQLISRAMQATIWQLSVTRAVLLATAELLHPIHTTVRSLTDNSRWPAMWQLQYNSPQGSSSSLWQDSRSQPCIIGQPGLHITPSFHVLLKTFLFCPSCRPPFLCTTQACIPCTTKPLHAWETTSSTTLQNLEQVPVRNNQFSAAVYVRVMAIGSS